MSSMGDSVLRVGIVGGSIAGLAAATVLQRAGADVEVFERSPTRDRSPGAGMSVDLDLVGQVTRAPGRALPHLSLERRRLVVDGTVTDERTAIDVSAYHLLREHLRPSVPAERYAAGREVAAIDAPSVGDLRLSFADGEQRTFDAVILADGRSSRFRGMAAGVDKPRYAGYVLVRGFVPEALLTDEARACFLEVPAMHLVSRRRYQLVAYPGPGPGGECEAGRRRVNFGWYYGAAEPWLRGELLADADASERIVPPAAPSPEVASSLSREADALWPPAYAALLRTAASAGALTVHPVYEHAPDRLAAGRIGVVGDAAHLASPITGSGARMSLLDALALGEAFEHERTDVVSALRRYQATRLASSVAIVAHGRSAGATFRV